MGYDVFIKKVKKALEERLGAGVSVSLTTVQKNNGVEYKGVAISEEAATTVPAIYLEAYYERYLSGQTLEQLVQELLEVYRQAKQRGGFDVKNFACFETARHRILYKLVNYERNTELLKQIPHVRFLDLAVVFYYLVEKQHRGSAMILIRNSHSEYWGVGTDELYAYAKKNTPVQLPFEILSLSQLLRETLDQEVPLEADAPMYVLSNEQRSLGAGCILYPDILREFGVMVGSDFYILPSSIHEVILLPVCEEEDPGRLREMVQEINETQVELQEQLSNQVYRYDRKAQRIRICC